MVSESNPKITSCETCTDAENPSCDLKSQENTGNIWRKTPNSCWQSYDGFVDVVVDTSDEETGEATDADLVDNDSISDGYDDDVKQNEDSNQSQNKDSSANQGMMKKTKKK